MEKIIIKAEERPAAGKGVARKLRMQGMIPAVLYRDGKSTSIRLQSKGVSSLLNSGIGEHTLINLVLQRGEDTTEHWALIKDYQIDPIRGELLHADFIEVSLENKIRITVPIALVKDSPGVKNGGILQHQMREVEIECLPTHIPDKIEVDISGVEIGHSIHVRDLVVKEDLRIVAEPEEVVLTITSPIVEEAAPAAPAEEIKEPEVIKKAKKEEVEEEK